MADNSESNATPFEVTNDPRDFSQFPRSTSVHEAAANVIKVLEVARNMILDYRVGDRETSDPRYAPSEYANALIIDTQSLALGILEGNIRTSQPRMATNLLAAIADLGNSRNHDIACLLTRALRDMSACGMAAENCSVGLVRRSDSAKGSEATHDL